jgi:hypothetical protein
MEGIKREQVVSDTRLDADDQAEETTFSIVVLSLWEAFP